jgi:hypothetical protein
MATGYRRLNDGDGATLAKDACALLLAAQSKLAQAAAMAGAVLARGTAAELEGAEFGAQSGEGQAVHDEIAGLSSALDTFMSTNATNIARYNPGG